MSNQNTSTPVNTLSHVSCLLEGVKESLELQAESETGLTNHQYMLMTVIDHISGLVGSVEIELRAQSEG